MTLRVLVLTHQTLDLPETIAGLTDEEVAPWKTEYDVVTALRDLGHEVNTLGGTDELAAIRQPLLEWEPDIVFNLLEEFRGEGLYVPYVLGYLQLMRKPYTGCNASGLMVADNKVLAKKILRYHRIPVPEFAVFSRGRVVKRPRHLSFPLIVKSSTGHSASPRHRSFPQTTNSPSALSSSTAISARTLSPKSSSRGANSTPVFWATGASRRFRFGRWCSRNYRTARRASQRQRSNGISNIRARAESRHALPPAYPTARKIEYTSSASVSTASWVSAGMPGWTFASPRKGVSISWSPTPIQTSLWTKISQNRPTPRGCRMRS